jgi:hypothetical protein
MELSKYNKLEKLGFTFWTKRQDNELELEPYLIGESVVLICSPRRVGLNLFERERFIHSIAHILNEETVKKVNIEKITKEDIKTVFLFDCTSMEGLEEDHIKILSYPSINNICSSSNSKKDFLVKFKEDLIL